MKGLTMLMLICLVLPATAQDTLTLQKCYEKAIEAAPVRQQKSIFTEETRLQKANINTARYPQLQFKAQATYQSDVTEVPLEIPGRSIPSPSQDQYKGVVEINQLIYDGGMLENKKQVADVSEQIARQDIEVQLYHRKQQVNELYFQVLLMEEQQTLVEILRKKIKIQLNEVQSGIRNGILLPNNAKMLRAELLKLDQREIEIQQKKTSALSRLGILIDQEINPETQFERPSPTYNNDNEIPLDRPEMQLFQYRQAKAKQQIAGLKARNRPKFSVFAQLGYGKPGLNFLSNEFDTYYLAGLSLSWKIWDWQKTDNERQLLQLQQEKIENRKMDFREKINVREANINAEINKINALIEKDKEIVAMREEITKTTSSQLNNGVINASEYLTQLNEENQARKNQKIHELQLIMTKMNYQMLYGH